MSAFRPTTIAAPSPNGTAACRSPLGGGQGSAGDYGYGSTVQFPFGYGMLLASTVTSACGGYTMGASEDGDISCELAETTRIVYNGYSDAGGFNISSGGIMTERDDFWAQFGPARTVSLDDTNTNRMMLDTGDFIISAAGLGA